MDETTKNLEALLGLAAIVLMLLFGVKAFREWWDERKIPISTLIESRVIKANGEQGFATFDSIEVDGRTWLILDRGNGPDIPPEYFRPKQQCIAQVSGDPKQRRHCGPAIDVGKYEELSLLRRGFYFSDGKSVTRY
jgi:hypothetical protein